jgi:hypothetical protein
VFSRITKARAGSVATFAALALAAALVDLGGFHRLEHGDSIVPVLVSLQRWTFFYWDQERYGMLVPLLALPLRDPLWNLLLQRFVLILAGLAAVVLLARHVLPGRDWRVAGALAAALVLLAWPAPWAFEYLGDQPYGLSLALALAGLAVAEPVARSGASPAPGLAAGRSSVRPERSARASGRGVEGRGSARLAAGLLLSVAAHWVNAATGLFLLPLAAARAAVDLAEGEERAAVRGRLIVDTGLLAAGLAAGQAMLRLWPVVTGYPLRLAMGPLPVAEWPSAWATLFGRAWSEAGALPAVLAAIAAAGVALLALPAFRPRSRTALLRALALAAAALAYALFTGTLSWVRDNAFHWRYLAPSVVLLQLAAVSLAVEPLSHAARLARPVLALAVALVPLAALAAAGSPSLARVRADLDDLSGARTEDVLAARCTLVAGDYWSVWPTVFHAALVAHERGLDARVYGLAHRANPTVPFWVELPLRDLRICRVHGAEGEADRYLRLYHLWPVALLERRGTVDVLVPAPPPGAEPATSGTTPAP